MQGDKEFKVAMQGDKEFKVVMQGDMEFKPKGEKTEVKEYKEEMRVKDKPLDDLDLMTKDMDSLLTIIISPVLGCSRWGRIQFLDNSMHLCTVI